MTQARPKAIQQLLEVTQNWPIAATMCNCGHHVSYQTRVSFTLFFFTETLTDGGGLRFYLNVAPLRGPTSEGQHIAIFSPTHIHTPPPFGAIHIPYPKRLIWWFNSM